MILRVSTPEGTCLFEKKIESFPVSIGRSAENHVAIAISAVSSKHLTVNWDGNELWFKDLGSRNGTFLDRERIAEKRQRPPCKVGLGNGVVLEFLLPETAAKSEASPLKNNSNNLLPRQPSIQNPSAPTTYCSPPLQSAQRAPIATPKRGVAAVLESRRSGLERYWQMMGELSGQKFLLLVLGIASLGAFLHGVVFWGDPLVALLAGLVIVLASTIGAAACAAFGALVALLFRGSYQFRPLFYTWTLAFALLALKGNVLEPGYLVPWIGGAFQALAFGIETAAFLAFIYVFLFNSFSHRYARGLMIFTIIFSSLAAVNSAKSALFPDKQAILKQAFLGEFLGTPTLGLKTNSTQAATDEIRDFGRRLATSQGR